MGADAHRAIEAREIGAVGSGPDLGHEVAHGIFHVAVGDDDRAVGFRRLGLGEGGRGRGREGPGKHSGACDPA